MSNKEKQVQDQFRQIEEAIQNNQLSTLCSTPEKRNEVHKTIMSQIANCQKRSSNARKVEKMLEKHWQRKGKRKRRKTITKVTTQTDSTMSNSDPLTELLGEYQYKTMGVDSFKTNIDENSVACCLNTCMKNLATDYFQWAVGEIGRRYMVIENGTYCVVCRDCKPRVIVWYGYLFNGLTGLLNVESEVRQLIDQQNDMLRKEDEEAEGTAKIQLS